MRQILIPSASNHIVDLPELYYGKRVLITVSTLGEKMDMFLKAEEARAFFNSIQVDLSSYKFDREEANER